MCGEATLLPWHITVKQNESQYYLELHQAQYILNMLVKYKMTEAKAIATPLDLSLKMMAIVRMLILLDISH